MKKRRTKKKGRMNRRTAVLFFLAVSCAMIACILFREGGKQAERSGEVEEIEGDGDTEPVPPESQEGKRNPDWIGWLKIKGTDISYPVMQKKGDGEFYLNRDFDGNPSRYGTPFMDERCTPASDNLIIYGHNIRGGKMFGALQSYAEERYYREHPAITLRIGKERRQYRIVSAIRTDTSCKIYSFTDTGNWTEYADHVCSILSGSAYPTEKAEEIRREMEEKTAEEFFKSRQFLTLSTCRGRAGGRERLLVVAARDTGQDNTARKER